MFCCRCFSVLAQGPHPTETDDMYSSLLHNFISSWLHRPPMSKETRVLRPATGRRQGEDIREAESDSLPSPGATGPSRRRSPRRAGPLREGPCGVPAPRRTEPGRPRRGCAAPGPSAASARSPGAEQPPGRRAAPAPKERAVVRHLHRGEG